MTWNAEATGIVRAELARRKLTYKALAALLNKNGIQETERSLANKISRGTFSFAFCIQVMNALGVKTISVEPTTLVGGLLAKGTRKLSG